MIQINSKNLEFKDALGNLTQFKHQIKLPEWGGYWFYFEDTIYVMFSNGEISKLIDAFDIFDMLSLTFRNDWISFTDTQHNHRIREAFKK